MLFYGKADKRQRWKKDDDSPPDSNSTLSLHITAYESFIEQDISAESSKVTEAISRLSVKEAISGDFSVVIKYPFEFPRQQNDQVSQPELSQFKASQRLLNPNSCVSAVNVSSGNDESSLVANTTVDPVNISSASPSSSTDENVTVTQNAQETVVPTEFEFFGGKFNKLNEGSDSELTFFFGGNVDFEGDDNLDPISLEFDGDQLFACFVGEHDPDEIVRGLKLTSSLEVLTDNSAKGPYNQLRYLLNRADGNQIDNPRPEDLFDFLVRYRNEKEENEHTNPKAARVPRKFKIAKPRSISNSAFEQQKLNNVKTKISGLASSLPEPDPMTLPIKSLFSDFCIRNASLSGVDAIVELMTSGKWKEENDTPLCVNKINGKFFVFLGNKRLMAMKKVRDSGDISKFEFVKCNVYEGLDLCQKVLIVNPSAINQGATTIIQKLKLLREVVESLAINSPKGKVLEETYAEIMGYLFHNDYPLILNQLIELPTADLDQLCTTQGGTTPLEELQLDSGFWNHFTSSYKKDPVKALNALPELGRKTKKEVEKLLKAVDTDLLRYLSERGPHTFETEKEAIMFFTEDPNCTKSELLKRFTTAKLNKNKSRKISKKKYDWDVVKSTIMGNDEEDGVFQNAKYLKTINVALINQQDLIIIQNPTTPQLQLLEKFGKKAVIILIGNFGDPVPELPTSSPTAAIKILMENPLKIDEIVSVLPDPVVNASLYLPGAPTGDKAEKIQYLTNVAKKKEVCIAATMTMENSHQIINFTAKQEKAALCFVSEKVAKHFLSHCGSFDEITVIGDEGLRAIVNLKISPPAKKRKTDPKDDDVVQV